MLPTEFVGYFQDHKDQPMQEQIEFLNKHAWARQNLTEFIPFMEWIDNHCMEFNNYLEIGMLHGGTFFLIDSLLRARNPKYDQAIGLDWKLEKMRERGLEIYKRTYNVIFIETCSLRYKLTHPVDLCLIDGCHKYHYIKNDFENVQPWAKYVVLHDINFRPKKKRNDINKYWLEIKDQYEHWEFVEPGNTNTAGIGVLKLR